MRSRSPSTRTSCLPVISPTTTATGYTSWPTVRFFRLCMSRSALLRWKRWPQSVRSSRRARAGVPVLLRVDGRARVGAGARRVDHRRPQSLAGGGIERDHARTALGGDRDVDGATGDRERGVDRPETLRGPQDRSGRRGREFPFNCHRTKLIRGSAVAAHGSDYKAAIPSLGTPRRFSSAPSSW